MTHDDVKKVRLNAVWLAVATTILTLIYWPIAGGYCWQLHAISFSFFLVLSTLYGDEEFNITGGWSPRANRIKWIIAKIIFVPVMIFVFILIIFLVSLLFTSCSKNIEGPEPTCAIYCLLSDKYGPDRKLITTDTLWGRAKDGVVYACGSDLKGMQEYGRQWKPYCPAGWPVSGLECTRYAFNREMTYPTIF